MSTQIAVPISGIACAEVAPGVSLTLAHYPNGWGFQHWRMAGEVAMNTQPSPADVARRFASSREAIDHFRSEYGDRFAI